MALQVRAISLPLQVSLLCLPPNPPPNRTPGFLLSPRSDPARLASARKMRKRFTPTLSYLHRRPRPIRNISQPQSRRGAARAHPAADLLQRARVTRQSHHQRARCESQSRVGDAAARSPGARRERARRARGQAGAHNTRGNAQSLAAAAKALDHRPVQAYGRVERAHLPQLRTHAHTHAAQMHTHTHTASGGGVSPAPAARPQQRQACTPPPRVGPRSPSPPPASRETLLSRRGSPACVFPSLTPLSLSRPRLGLCKTVRGKKDTNGARQRPI